jgi:hypothetical protein
MPETFDTITQKLLDDIGKPDLTDEEASTKIKNLKTVAETQKLLEPEPTPVPEPTGLKGFFNKHAGDLIKVGGTVTVVSLIAVLEAKGDLIFRSKASKFI